MGWGHSAKSTWIINFQMFNSRIVGGDGGRLQLEDQNRPTEPASSANNRTGPSSRAQSFPTPIVCGAFWAVFINFVYLRFQAHQLLLADGVRQILDRFGRNGPLRWWWWRRRMKIMTEQDSELLFLISRVIWDKGSCMNHVAFKLPISNLNSTWLFLHSKF